MKQHKINHSVKSQTFIFFLLLIFILNRGIIEKNSPINTLIPNVDSPNPRSFNLKTSESRYVYCTGNFSDMGEDLDGDLLYDHIILFMEINVTRYYPNITVILTVQAKTTNETPIGDSFETSRSYLGKEIGIHNLTISLVNASRFHGIGHELMFHIHRLRINGIHEFLLAPVAISNEYDLYTTRIYTNVNFDLYIRFAGQIWDRAEDIDFNWRYDYLLIEISVEILQESKYLVRMSLEPEARTGEYLTGSNTSFLEKGVNIISIRFDADSLRGLKINGPLVVTNIKIYDETDIIVYQANLDYVTQVYSYTDFDIHSVVINGNEEFATFVKSEKFKGDGSLLNPYIITGLVITEQNSKKYFVNIENVDVVFHLTNSIFHRGKTAIHLGNITYCLIENNDFLDNQVGIYLTHVDNSIIRRNTIIDHDVGISLSYAGNNVVESNTFDKNTQSIKTFRSSNNTIVNNTISGRKKQQVEDIGLLLGTGSHNNMILQNDFQKNTLDAGDYGLNNTFQSNYWEDWTGEGYFQIPTENYDISPSRMPNHIVGPTIISPEGTCLDSVIEIKWVAYDALNHKLTYDIYLSTNNRTVDGNWSLLTSGLTQNYFEWYVRNVTDGNYQIKIVAYDSMGFTSWNVSDLFAIQTPVNLTPVISPLLGMIILILVCVSLLIKFT